MPGKKRTNRMSGLQDQQPIDGGMAGAGMEGEATGTEMPSFDMGASSHLEGSDPRQMPGGGSAMAEGSTDSEASGPVGGMPQGGMEAASQQGVGSERVLVEMRVPRSLDGVAALSFAGEVDVPGFQLDSG